MRLSWGWALSHSSCYPAVTSSWELEEPTHMLPSLSSQQCQHLCRTGQKAEDSNVFNCFCQQWRSFLTKSRAMYFLVEVHQPANDAILLSNAFTWGLWLTLTLETCVITHSFRPERCNVGLWKGLFWTAYWGNKKVNKGKTEVSGELWRDVCYGISHRSSGTQLRRKPTLLRSGFPTGVGEWKGLGVWRQRRHHSRTLCRPCCGLLTQRPLL